MSRVDPPRQTKMPETKIIHCRVEYDFVNGRYILRGGGPAATQPIVNVPLTDEQVKLFHKMLEYP